MIGPIARILARYLAGALIAKGFLDATTGSALATDADVVAVVQTVLGLAVGGVTEGFYFLARKLGWAK
jgi:hypothetical protein